MTVATVEQVDNAAVGLPAEAPPPTEGAARDGAPAAALRRHALKRRWDDLPLRTKGMAVIAIPVLPLLVSALLFMAGARNTNKPSDRVAQTLHVEVQIATVLGLMVDAETGVRGFLLTHDPESLRPFDNAIAALPAATERLEALVSDNPVQAEHFRTVRSLMSASPLSRLLDFARANPNAPAPRSLLAESGTAMEALRQELAGMQAVEDRLLALRSREARRRLVQFGLAAASFGLFGGVFAALAFTSGVARRVDRVRDDATRLAHGADLLPLVETRDEVGALDRSLHDAALLLRRREEQLRQQAREQAALNHELELARNELDQFFSLSLDVMGIAGTDGRFIRVNAAWERTLGWTQAELTSVPFLDFVHPDDRDATATEAGKLAAGHATVSFENRYRARDGTYRWLNWSAVATPERDLLYCAARDVTDQKRAAAELSERAAELAAVNHELEAFSYSVSHDLRAPLRHVTGFASLLRRSVADRLTATEARHLQTIVDAANRMGRLIDDLLAFSRMSRAAFTPQRVSLDDTVRDVQAEVQAAAADREVRWMVHPLPVVDGDPAMLRLVLVNLLSNAVKYSAGRAPAEIEVGVQRGNADETVVYVRDNGAGFDMQYAHKLFGVFQRLHSADEFEGTGVGLANVRRIVHRHGGRVWADGVVDGGATFFFSLPTTERPPCDR